MPAWLLPAAQGLLGLGQTLFSGAKKAEKQLENLKSPTYSQNKSIMDFYNQSLQRYNVSPTDSAMFKRQTRDIDRGVAGAVAGLNDRRSGIAGISSILRGANDARLDANVAAENEKSNRFDTLGNATGMKANEDRTAFEINEQQPFERKYNLLAMKAAGKNQKANAGISNIFGGLQSGTMMNMYNQEYGTGNTGRSSGTGSNQGVSTEWLMKNRPMKPIFKR